MNSPGSGTVIGSPGDLAGGGVQVKAGKGGTVGATGGIGVFYVVIAAAIGEGCAIHIVVITTISRIDRCDGGILRSGLITDSIKHRRLVGACYGDAKLLMRIHGICKAVDENSRNVQRNVNSCNQVIFCQC